MIFIMINKIYFKLKVSNMYFYHSYFVNLIRENDLFDYDPLTNQS